MKMSQLHIAEPCHENWDEMTIEGKRRFCDHCSKHVHDLSAMTESEAAAALKGPGRKCVRYKVDPDGEIIFAKPRPEPTVVPISALRRRPRRAPMRAAAAAVVALAACTPHGQETMGEPVIVQIPRTQPGSVNVVPDNPTAPPKHERMGKVAVEPTEPEVLMGDVGIPQQPCDPQQKPVAQPVHEVKGEIAPEPRELRMGRIAPRSSR